MTYAAQRAPEQHAIDPVCGMTIPIADAPTRDFEGVTYHFCSELCVSRFDRDGMAYLATARLDLAGWGQTPMPGFLMPPLPAEGSRSARPAAPARDRDEPPRNTGGRPQPRQSSLSSVLR
jgi:YHS domain-containing protein